MDSQVVLVLLAEDHMIRKRDTANLMQLLGENRDLPQLLEKCADDLNCPTIVEFLTKCQQKCGLSIAQIADASLLSQSFVYQIFSGIRKPGRNVLICIARIMNLDIDCTQRLLRLAQKGELYPRIKRDAVIIFGIQHGYTLLEIDEMLQEIDETPLVLHTM